MAKKKRMVLLLSVNQLRKVEEQLGEEKQQMLKKKKVKLADVHRINDEKKCLKMWIEEAGRREKKAALREMPKSDKKGAEGEAAAAKPTAPPPYVSDGSLPSPYAILQAALQAMKPDPDSCPPAPQQPQQDYQLQGPVQPPHHQAQLQSSTASTTKTPTPTIACVFILAPRKRESPIGAKGFWFQTSRLGI